MTAPYLLFGTDHSYFTGKVRPYLRFKGIPFREKQVTLWTYQRVIVPKTGTRFIPVVRTPQNEFLQDTSVIIDTLEQRHPERPITPPGAAQQLVNLLFEVYADEWFLLPGMHYRWSYIDDQRDYLMREFGKIAGPFLPGPLGKMVGKTISKPFHGSLKFLGVTEKTRDAVERRFEEFLQHFERHLDAQPFLLGSRPCLGDFALAGPLYAHLARDPVPRALMQRIAPRTLEWIARINRIDAPPGEFLPNDEVPDTLLPILMHLFAEQWPILIDTANHLPAWAETHPQKATVSRALGWHEFLIDGSREKRLMFSNAVWMMQRPLDHYHSLTVDQKSGVDVLLKACDGWSAMQFQPPLRLDRANNQLVIQR